jgi:BMFP domain-containing protein YqiC
MSAKKPDVPAPKPVSPQKAAYDAWVRQSSAQWDALLRNPNFLASSASSFNLFMNAVGRFRDMVGMSLRTMNIPTRDDLAALNRKLDDIQDRLDEISERLDRLEAAPKPRAPRKTAQTVTKTKKTSKASPIRLVAARKPAKKSAA